MVRRALSGRKDRVDNDDVVILQLDMVIRLLFDGNRLVLCGGRNKAKSYASGED